jgi:hypothetical protein
VEETVRAGSERFNIRWLRPTGSTILPFRLNLPAPPPNLHPQPRRCCIRSKCLLSPCDHNEYCMAITGSRSAASCDGTSQASWAMTRQYPIKTQQRHQDCPTPTYVQRRRKKQRILWSGTESESVAIVYHHRPRKDKGKKSHEAC